MSRQTSTGTCNLCGKPFAKAAMTRHLVKCKTEHLKRDLEEKRVFHLQVEGRYAPGYWMHIEIPADAALKTLDSFLRRTWLECCGHLSMFTIAGEMFDIAPEPDLWTGRKPRSMSTKLSEMLAPGMKFEHEYDFGTTTKLALKVVAERHGAIKSVQVIARNDPPEIPCAKCAEPATQVCTQCIYEGPQAWLCNKHAAIHNCGEDYFLPVVNSPRVGMCGYTG